MKYIIDIEDQAENGLYRAKAFRSLVFDEFGLEKLMPFDEEMIEDEMKDRFEEGFQAGMKKAWNAARKIVCWMQDGGIDGTELYRIFGTGVVGHIMRDVDAEEAVRKLEEYEADGKILIGDEVTAEGGAAKFVVTHIANDIAGIDSDGKVYSYLPGEIDGKTGRHFTVHVEQNGAEA